MARSVPNVVVSHGENSVILLRRRSGETVECVVDSADVPALLSVGVWTAQHPGKYGHVYAKIANGRIAVLMHRVILGATPGDYVDHINGDTLDNRRINLRITDKFGNAFNRRPNGRSHLRGVHWNAARNKWVAVVKANGKSNYLGIFADLEDARTAAKRFAESTGLLPPGKAYQPAALSHAESVEVPFVAGQRLLNQHCLPGGAA